MKIELDFNDRQYNDIETYCKSNNLDIKEYLIGVITEKHTINKFGDLNDLIPKVIEECTVSVKKRGRPKKTIAEKETTIDRPSKIEKNESNRKTIVEIEPSRNVENIVVEQQQEDIIVKPTVKRKRSLKTL